MATRKRQCGRKFILGLGLFVAVTLTREFGLVNEGKKNGTKQAGNDDYDYDEGRYLFFRLVAQGRRTS